MAEDDVKIIKANAKIVRGLECPDEIMKFLETVGRVSHASGESKDQQTAERFVKMIIRLGHDSVLEHVNVTVLVECDRAMAQQWTRHRLASYTMESQRYVDYKELVFIDPQFRDDLMYETFKDSCRQSASTYFSMRKSSVPPEDARAILPNATKTLFYTTANLRTWRHIFKMRCAPGAQHNIREVMRDLLRQFYKLIPAVFEDIVDPKYI